MPSYCIINWHPVVTESLAKLLASLVRLALALPAALVALEILIALKAPLALPVLVTFASVMLKALVLLVVFRVDVPVVVQAVLPATREGSRKALHEYRAQPFRFAWLISRESPRVLTIVALRQNL